MPLMSVINVLPCAQHAGFTHRHIFILSPPPTHTHTQTSGYPPSFKTHSAGLNHCKNVGHCTEAELAHAAV